MYMSNSLENKDLPDSKLLREVEFSEYLNFDMLNGWLETIPLYDKNDLSIPGWPKSPVHELDLSRYNFKGRLLVKDESPLDVNPTGTFKDRAAWEVASLYRDFAAGVIADIENGIISVEEVSRMKAPKFSLISAGNEGAAVACFMEKHRLPPPKILIAEETPSDTKEKLMTLYCDLYETRFEDVELTGNDILQLTENEDGEDLTSSHRFKPGEVYYDLMTHRLFNRMDEICEADSRPRIYLPHGSGRLMENVVFWQGEIRRKAARNIVDPKFGGNASMIANADVFGAEPTTARVADKVHAEFRPFVTYTRDDIATRRRARETGMESDIEIVQDDFIEGAHQIYKDFGIRAEPSGAIGLALALKHNEEGRIKPGQTVFTVNTGKGIISEPIEEMQRIRERILKAS